ncbi:MAG: hypothetical protein NC097_08195 [Clostridium sp.]|nr:hypothetical protein [Prevotella sp.]MCM1429755.1 hypothetical protein [Clostridium sp.]MCM1474930.1 hypothetical protein [Muribaculaceae bacterium]
MKKSLIFALALPTLLLSACGGETTSLSDVKDATKGDSIAFYYGRSKGFDFWNEAENDTTLRGEDARKEFLKGVKDGMDAVKDNAAYNYGLMIGMGVAQDIIDLHKTYPGVEMPRDLFLSSLKGALKNDSVVDGVQTKADLYKIMDQMARQKELEDTKAAQASLASTAKQLSMTKINDYLYGKIITNGDGQVLKDGDKVSLDITAATVDGQPIGMQFPREIVVGRNLSSPLISQALRTMKVGQTSQFIASPIQLMPRRYRAGEYKGTDLVKFTIKVNSISDATE